MPPANKHRSQMRLKIALEETLPSSMHSQKVTPTPGPPPTANLSLSLNLPPNLDPIPALPLSPDPNQSLSLALSPRISASAVRKRSPMLLFRSTLRPLWSQVLRRPNKRR